MVCRRLPDIDFIPIEEDITEDGIIYPSDSDEELEILCITPYVAVRFTKTCMYM